MMKFFWLTVLLIGLLVSQAVAQQNAPASTPATPAASAPATPPASAPTTPAFATTLQKVSYSIGVEMGRMFAQQKIELDLDTFFKGFKEALSGATLQMTDEEMRATVTAFQTELRKKQTEARKALAEENKKAGEAFLAENKKKEGVVTLPSGLQYKILKAGEGKKPTDKDTVLCNYRGTLLNGTEFDSSARYGDKPSEFVVTDVIKGWTEALQLMPVGSKWQLFVPSDLAYGPSGRGPIIGPNAMLIFELELVGIK